MPDVWTWLVVATLPAVALELLVLRRFQRAWIAAGRHPEVPHGRDALTGRRTEPPGAGAQAAQEGWFIGSPDAESDARSSAKAVLCFDPGGQCTAANIAGRRLLPGSEGQNTLGHLLYGGPPAAASLLALVDAQGILEQDEAIVSGAASTLVHLKALALRDRDSNFWGVALFIRPEAERPEPAAADRSGH